MVKIINKESLSANLSMEDLVEVVGSDAGTRSREYPPDIQSILETVDTLISTHLNFETKINEGQQALIFRIDTDQDSENGNGKGKRIEGFFPESQSLKVLKITDSEVVRNEFDWLFKAYSLYESIPDDEKGEYAKIPKPLLCHNIQINETVRNKLNSQNANLINKAISVLLMEWVEGEDLLTQLFRKYLGGVGGYEQKASDPATTFQSLLLSVGQQYQSRALDFSSMDTLKQYKSLLTSINRKGQSLLSEKQRAQVNNTLQLLHGNNIYHNDLHLRNIITQGVDGQPCIIDFGRANSRPNAYEDNIDDGFVTRLLEEFHTNEQRMLDLGRTITADISRIRKHDRDLENRTKKFIKFSDLECVSEMTYLYPMWKIDEWEIKKFVATILEVKLVDKNRAGFMLEFISDQSKDFNEQGKSIVEWLRSQF